MRQPAGNEPWARLPGITNAPIYVARTTCCAKVRPSQELGNAQRALANPAEGILAGPDFDTLGFADRYDRCHFSTEGMERAADLWLAALKVPSAPNRVR
jgi:hypothetical protein